VFGSKAAVDLATATVTELDKESSARKLEVPDAGQDSTYLSLASFIDNARGTRCRSITPISPHLKPNVHTRPQIHL